MFAPSLREIRGRLLHDVCVGIVVPVLLLLSPMSPFRDSSWGPARLEYLEYVVYFCTATAGLSFVLGLTARAKQYGEVIAGGLALPAVVAAVAGVAWLPPRIIGILIGLVVGGFVPFLVAVSLSRLAHNAFFSSDRRRRWLFTCTMLVTAFVSVLLAYTTWATDTERLVRQKIDDLHIGQSLSLRETVPGPWTSVTDFGAYTGRAEIERTLGFNWDSPRKSVLEYGEGHLLLVFASKTTVVESVVLSTNVPGRLCLDGEIIRRIPWAEKCGAH